ncbi:MAG: cephalosporin hydroxylase family protein [Nitrosopumilus sp.]|nr:cephalosporin hydroxylase family protein [Nitrosopumilus sp.]
MIDKAFEKKNKTNILKMSKDKNFQKLTKSWFKSSEKFQYSYHFSWMGRPIIQYPQDMIALQELIWKIKPDLIIETGIARGGSLIFSASILQLIGKGRVVGIDVDIRKHNRIEIEKHSMFKRIKMIEGSSIDSKVVKKVYQLAKNKKQILVILDSNHSHEHVLKELELYSPLVTKNSYLIVFDTVIEDISTSQTKSHQKRPWGKGNNPKTAVNSFLASNKRFIIDKEIENKLMITVAPSGFLKCIKK